MPLLALTLVCAVLFDNHVCVEGIAIDRGLDKVPAVSFHFAGLNNDPTQQLNLIDMLRSCPGYLDHF